MSKVQAGSPARFLVFLLVVAVVFAYIAAKWDDFNHQSALYEGSAGGVDLGQQGGAAVGLEGSEAGSSPSSEGAATGEGTAQLPGEATPDLEGGSFAELRVQRTAIYDRQIEQLQAIANDPDASASAREQAQQALVQLTQRQGVEQQIEQLIRSKGYEDAVVFVYDQAAIVVVKADRFAQADAARIADIVRQVTGIGYEGIRIVTRNG
ncbi:MULTISPECIES: SpoIIIAH-like family protein [Thermaerobacter]|uniref:SpoIIIAH-like family protein n=1 Tax=Thermaerobacter composti TaxID=554949 RepID=A0ABZ0QRM3_9FIRM|nr:MULTISPECIES: SpoIIIAH-like family protein [Thermaerobacter]QBS37973.1 SpoIIIAH-like family protein [Thermaerobacter sp. FW80]WPD20143.1 SpoIIIAH-like family protein [Thermaerobacter composti]